MTEEKKEESVGRFHESGRNKLGEFIKKRRLELGFNKRQLAQLANLNRNSIWLMETGRFRFIHVKTMESLALALQCEATELKKLIPVQRFGVKNIAPCKTPLGEFIREKRRQLGWRQRQLGEKAGLTISSVSLYETGAKQPTRQVMEKIAAALQCDIEELMAFVPKEKLPEPTTELSQLIVTRLEALGLTIRQAVEKTKINRRILTRLVIGDKPTVSRQTAKRLVFSIDIKMAEIEKFIFPPKGLSRNTRSVKYNMAPCKTPIGVYIRKKRLDLGWRQKKLADKAGLALASISRYEIGAKFPSRRAMEKIVVALQCDYEEFMGFLPKEILPEPTTEIGRLIVTRLEKLKLTIRQAAEKTKISKSILTLLITGAKHAISYSTAKKLFHSLNIQMAEIEKFILPSASKKPLCRVGDFLRRRRRELGLSINDLAKRLEISRQQVDVMEVGRYRFSNEKTFQRLVEILKLDPEKLKALISMKPPRKLKEKKYEKSTLGGFLTARRLRLGLTLVEVGRRAQLSASVVGGYENNKYNIKIPILDRLKQALECEIPVELIQEIDNELLLDKEKSIKLGRFLFNRRRQLELTQSWVASQAQISPPTLSNMEKGKITRLREKLLRALAKALDCQIPMELTVDQGENRVGDQN